MFTPLREKCPYSKLFWSAFSGIRTEYGEILFNPNTGKYGADNPEYGHFLRSVQLEFLVHIQLHDYFFFL